ncbi:MAG: response regulator transcription factor [Clostridium sp.]
MYNVLLVDDEPLIRKGLLKIINWKALGCQVISDVSSGLEACDVLSREHIDIVISDIKMPEMTGIELSKYIYENKPNTKIILLTGYSDFTYAQAALKYNVIDFILKPTNTENIASAINKAKLSLIKAQNNESKIKVLEEKMLSSNEKLKSTILNDIIHGIYEKNTISQKLKEIDICLNNYYVLVSKIKDTSCNIEDIIDIFPLIFSNVTNYNIILNNNTIATIVDSKNFTNTSIIDLCNESITMLKNFKSCDIFFGISNLYCDDSLLPNGFIEANSALDFTFYDCVGEKIFVFGNCSAMEIDCSTTNNYVNNIINHLNNIEFNHLMNEINIMFKIFRDNKYSIDHIKHICILICSKCSDLLLNDSMSFIDLIENPNIFSDILSCSSIGKLHSILSNCIDITFYSLNNKPNEKNSIVDNARGYISKNYNDTSLTLNEIANHVHVSNAYLSRLFKEKTGETISELIIKIRINKAKDLLRNTQMKIYEIAYEIGIDDPAYFSQLFKKRTGLSPKEYKYKH